MSTDLAAPWTRLARENEVVGFIDTLLRGVGQVMFQNNPVTGLLFLVGIFFNSYLFGIAGLIGLAASTITAMVLGVDRPLIRAGLFGYNGILVGIALAFFLQWNAALLVYIILGSIFSTVILMALMHFLSPWDMPALTFPFVLATWLFLSAALLFANMRIGGLITPALPRPNAAINTILRPAPLIVTPDAGLTVVNLLQAIFRGVGEVFFENNLVTGIIFVIAILVNSRISAGFAFLGSLIGLVAAQWFLGLDGYQTYVGLYGFNAVLCAIAVGGVFYAFDWKSGLYALVCALVSTVVMASITVLLSPLGLPALTAPFVFTTWLFLLPKAGFHVLHPVALADVTAPEQLLAAMREREHARPATSSVQEEGSIQ